MSITHRKPRPLRRDPTALRDTRLCIVACDDTYAPEQYFGFFQFRGVQIHVVPTVDSTSAARHVLNRLLAFDHEDDDELWLLLDTDHCLDDNHFPGFVSVLEEARQQRIRVCLSRPCFEFWLLLHHREPEELTGLKNAREVCSELSRVLGGYNKTRLRREHYPLPAVRAACERAARLDGTVQGGHRPEANTTRVHELWRSVIAGMPFPQRPEEMRDLQRFPGTLSEGSPQAGGS